jgi:hypothetical protein
MTSINNLQSILEHGLLSHNEAHRLRIVTDISDPTVQNLRRNWIINHIALHDYVPLYFSPRNPMLFRRRELQDSIIILGIDPTLLLHEKTIFSDGNAAASETKFYRGVSLLNQLSWNVINAKYWNDFEDGKRIKCAEILIYPKIHVNSIFKIFCYCQDQLVSLQQIIPRSFNIKTEINYNLYF